MVVLLWVVSLKEKNEKETNNALLPFSMLFYCRYQIYAKKDIKFMLQQIFALLCFTAAVCKEIQDETDRVTGKSKQISPFPIHLSIYSPNGTFLRR